MQSFYTKDGLLNVENEKISFKKVVETKTYEWEALFFWLAYSYFTITDDKKMWEVNS